MRFTTKKLVLSALMTAIVFIITFTPFLQIPSPMTQGYYNIGDAAIMIAAILLGRRVGFVAGGIGSALADIVTGYYIYAPATLIIKGIEGYIIGAIGSNKNGVPSRMRQAVAVTAGGLEMVLGYFLYQVTVMRAINPTLGMASIIADLPGNLIQGGLSAVLALIFLTVLFRTKAVKNLIR